MVNMNNLITYGTMLASILATNKAISGKISGFSLYLGLGGSLVVGYIVGGIVERKVGE
jgi:hypothetical protein